MGHEHECGAGGGVEFEKHVDNRSARFVVEVAGRFVGEEDFRAVDEGAGQGHALLLAAGELRRVVSGAVAEPDAGEDFVGSLLRAAHAAQFERHEDVFQRGQRGKELETLEDESGGGIAQGGDGVLIEFVETASVELDVSGGRPVQTGAESEQGGLATAGGSDDGAVRTGGDVEVDAGENGERTSAAAVGFAEAAHGEEGRDGVFALGRDGIRGLVGGHMRWSFYVFLAVLVSAAGRAEDPAPQIVILGDSITAGYNLEPEEAYPALLQEKIKAAGLKHEVINAGLSGDTTAGGLRRLDWVLAEGAPEVLVVALGGNDGLRGLPVSQVKANLAAIIARTRAANPAVKIIVAGMQMPDSMGRDYAESFAAVFREVAAAEDVGLVPFLLEGVAGEAPLNQPDRIHPTADGQRRIAENVWPVLRGLL